MIMIRFISGNLTPSEAWAVKDVRLLSLRSGTGKTLTTETELEQVDEEVRYILHFGGWIGERCGQLLELFELKIEGGAGLRLL